MIDHVLLLLIMGIAAAGAIALVTRAVVGDALAVGAASIGWYIGCFVPLVLVQAGRMPDPLGLVRGRDFAGAASLHLSLFALVAVTQLAWNRRLRHPRTAHDDGAAEAPEPRQKSVGVLAAIMGGVGVAWACWLVALDGRVSTYTAGMLLTCLVLAASATVASVVLSATLRWRFADRVAMDGLLAGLAAASAAAATLPVGGAAATGIVAGLLGAATSQRIRRRRAGRALEIMGAAAVGAVTGLLSLGLLDVRAGFFFSGQPDLAVSQLVLVVSAIAVSAVMGLGVVVFVRVTRGALSLWAIPDSNR